MSHVVIPTCSLDDDEWKDLIDDWAKANGVGNRLVTLTVGVDLVPSGANFAPISADFAGLSKGSNLRASEKMHILLADVARIV